jgi:hypothetical protein
MLTHFWCYVLHLIMTRFDSIHSKWNFTIGRSFKSDSIVRFYS